MDNLNSIPALISSLLDDTRDLVRQELALARAEVHQEVAKAQTMAISFGAAAFAALCGLILLLVAVGGAIAYLAGWPSWAGYGIVALGLMAGALLLARHGGRQLAALGNVLPETRESVKENLQWIRNRSAAK